MNPEEEILKQKNEIKHLKLKLDAVINVLAEEGLLTHNEIDATVKEILDKKDDS